MEICLPLSVYIARVLELEKVLAYIIIIYNIVYFDYYNTKNNFLVL